MKWGKWGVFSRCFQAKNEKEMISNWKSELNGALRVFDRVRSVTLVKNIANFPVPGGTCDEQNCTRLHYSSQRREN